MVLDPSAATELPPACRPAKAVDKIRLSFRKDGSIRWLSHHDLMRTFERMLRRSGLPVRTTQGFHPHPRVVFALSLPLGVIGRAEIVEVELDEEIPPGQVRDRLQAQCPPGLAILDARRIAPGTTARVTGLCYGLRVPADRVEAVSQTIPALLAASSCLVERERPTRRRVDIRPFVRGIRLDPASGWLEIDLWLTPAGTARPEEVLTQLRLADLLDEGESLERVRLDLTEDNPPPPGPACPPGQLSSLHDSGA